MECAKTILCLLLDPALANGFQQQLKAAGAEYGALNQRRNYLPMNLPTDAPLPSFRLPFVLLVVISFLFQALRDQPKRLLSEGFPQSDGYGSRPRTAQPMELWPISKPSSKRIGFLLAIIEVLLVVWLRNQDKVSERSPFLSLLGNDIVVNSASKNRLPARGAGFVFR